jgi:chromosome segregation ATPase
MEALLEKLKDYSRYLELEDKLPYWESERQEKQMRLAELQRNLKQKQLQQDSLQTPTFFTKIFGKAENKREKLNKQIQEIMATLTAVRWESESLEKKIVAGKQELEALTDSRENYEKAKSQRTLTPAQESRLMMEEISAFVPAAQETAGRLQSILEDAALWIRQGSTNYAGYEAQAKQAAVRLAGILDILPEGVASVGEYLSAPEGYFDTDQPMDRICSALEQIQTIQNQLRLLLGE